MASSRPFDFSCRDGPSAFLVFASSFSLLCVCVCVSCKNNSSQIESGEDKKSTNKEKDVRKKNVLPLFFFFLLLLFYRAPLFCIEKVIRKRSMETRSAARSVPRQHPYDLI